MAKSNRYTEYTPQDYHSLFQPINFEEILQLGALKEKQFEQGQAAADELSNTFLNIKSLDVDNPRAKEIGNQYEADLQKIISDSKGDYSTITPKLRSLKTKYAKDALQGEIAAIQGNYGAHAADKERIIELVDKKLVDSSIGAKLLEQSLYNYKGIGTPNALGKYNLYKSSSPAEQVSFSDEAEKRAKGWMADAEAKGQIVKQGGYWVKTDGSREQITAQEIYDSVYNDMLNDPKIKAYANQLGSLDTYKIPLQNAPDGTQYYDLGNKYYSPSLPSDVSNEYISNAVKLAANKYSYLKTKDDISINEDAFALKDYENQSAKDLYRYNLPATNLPKEGVPDKIRTNADGSVLGQGNQSIVTSSIENAKETGKSAFEGIWGILQMNTLLPFFDPAGAQESFTKSSIYNAMSKVPSPDKQKLTDISAQEFRKQFPKLNEMFPENKKKNDKGSYDANAANVINYVHDAMMQNQTIINQIDVPSDPVKASVKNQLFNTNTFSKLNYKLSTGGKLETKDEANKQIGKITQEKLDKAQFNGFAGFADPGAIYAQMPNDDDEMVNITLEPDNTTKEIYFHSRDASKVYKTGKPITAVKNINDGKKLTPYVFEYYPDINEEGVKVLINYYEYDPKTKSKGKQLNINPETGLAEPENAFEKYNEEYKMWTEYNKFKLK